MPEMRRVRVAIVGSGFGGVAAAIRLRQAGVHDFVILERAGDLGGVWRENSYPGCACDVESHLYELSFAPNPDWTRWYPPRDEIWAYIRRLAQDHELTPFIRYNEEVTRAAWDEASARWEITSTGGRWSAQVLVAAPGALATPRLPDLPGLDRFGGPVFHSARWDHDVDLRGKRVAVLGTGASAVQFVPAIQPEVARLILFQRTPGWVIPRRDRPVSPRLRALFRRRPAVQRALRRLLYVRHEALGVAFRHPRLMRVMDPIARRHLRRSVPDPALRARLTPDYTLGCKRVLVSDDWYPALQQPNVELVTGGAVAAGPGTVTGADGVARPADVIVCGTGFQVTEFVFARCVRGRDGHLLSDTWGPSPQAHLGTTVTGFPNLFLLSGPNTGLGHSSVLLMFEPQVEHLLNALRYMDAHGLAAVEPRPEAQRAFVEAVDRRMRNTVWLRGGCRSWYLDSTGRNSTLWPGTPAAFRRRVSPFRPREYAVRTATG